MEGDDASDKYRAHSRRDLEMLSPLATREVSGSLGRQLWMKQKDATIAKVSCWRGTDALCTCKRSRAACGCTALTRFCVPRYTPPAAKGGTGARPTHEHVQHLASRFQQFHAALRQYAGRDSP